MSITLRNYQADCLKAVFKNVYDGITRQLISLPTGTGKTVVFAHLIKKISGHSLILVHRDELLNQAKEKMLIVDPKADIGIIKASRNETKHQIIIASVQTLYRDNRLDMLDGGRFSIIVTDEAHHSVADSYRKIYDRLLIDDKQIHVGVTATANRADKIGLGDVYKKIVFHRSLIEMILAGWLCDLRCMQVRTSISLAKVGVNRGDFNQGELSDVVNTRNRNELIVKAYEERASSRLALCFTVDVAHAENLNKTFNEKGIRSAIISAKTPIEERHEILQDFHKKKIQVLCNCQVLTEGYDEPAVDCIILARPTKSSVLYTQMIGRGTRIFPGKKDCLILDVSDNAGRHSVIQLPSLIGISHKVKTDGSETVASMYAKDQKRIADKLDGQGIITENIDIFNSSELVWIGVDDRYILELGGKGRITVMPSKKTIGRYVATFNSQEEGFKFITDRPVDLSWAIGIAETKAREIAIDKIGLMMKNARWRGQPASSKQKELLDKHGVKYDVFVTKGEASVLIARALASRQGKTISEQLMLPGVSK